MSMRQFVGTMPHGIAQLPRDKRGFPIPAFTPIIKGEPDFRGADFRYMRRCIKEDRCWICGGRMNRFKAFVIGPMCCVNRVSSEPPSHYECGLFAALNCPFLTRPLAKRGSFEDGEIVTKPGGIMIERNPGCCAVWLTRSYKTFDANGTLFEIGPPERVEFYANARRATRAEVEESVLTGLPFLEQAAAADGKEGLAALAAQVLKFKPLLERIAA